MKPTPRPFPTKNFAYLTNQSKLKKILHTTDHDTIRKYVVSILGQLNKSHWFVSSQVEIIMITTLGPLAEK